MSGGDVPCINVQDLVGRSPKAQRQLDLAHGFTSAFLAKCACGGALEFDTDELGRSVERCTACGKGKLTTVVVPRPEGEGYGTQFRASPGRRVRRPLPDTSDDPDVRRLRETREARGGEMKPELLDAQRAYDALLADEKAARKAGRPRKNFVVGRAPPRDPPPATRPPTPIDKPAPPIPPDVPVRSIPPEKPVRPPAPVQPMAITKKCQRSGKEFTARGPAQRYCGECPACEVAAAGKVTPASGRRTAKKASARKKSAHTGYRSKTPPPATTGGDVGGVLTQLRAQRADLVKRTEQLDEAIEILEGLAAA